MLFFVLCVLFVAGVVFVFVFLVCVCVVLLLGMDPLFLCVCVDLPNHGPEINPQSCRYHGSPV